MDGKALTEGSASEHVPAIELACGDPSQFTKRYAEGIKAVGCYAVLNYRVPTREVGKALEDACDFFRPAVEDSYVPPKAVIIDLAGSKSSRKGEHSYIEGTSEASDEGVPFLIQASCYESSLVISDLTRIRNKYGIPDGFILSLPHFVNNGCSVTKGHTVLYEAQFKAGLRLPFDSFIEELLNHLGLAPGQLAPNAWRIVQFCVQLWPRCFGKSAELSVVEFLYFYKLVSASNSPHHCFFVARDSDAKLMIDLPSSNGSWKNRYFLVSGPLLEGVSCSWGVPNKSVFVRPELDEFHLNRVKMALEFSRRERNEKINQKRMNTEIQAQKKAKLSTLGKGKASSELPSQESSAHRVTPLVIGPTTSVVVANQPLIVVEGPQRPSKGKEVAISPTIDTDGALETGGPGRSLLSKRSPSTSKG